MLILCLAMALSQVDVRDADCGYSLSEPGYQYLVRLADHDETAHTVPKAVVTPVVPAKGHYENRTVCNGRSCSVKSVWVPDKVATTIDIPQRSGPHWTYPGEISRHLQNSHGYTADQLKGLTRDQMETLHDNAHEGGVGSSRGSGNSGKIRNVVTFPVRIFRR